MTKKKYYQTEEFLKLSREWDKKLEDEGFEPLGTLESGTVINPQKFTVTDPTEIGGSNYSKLCQQILSEFEFQRDIDYVIFELHTQGKTVRYIEHHLRQNGLRNYSFRQCLNIIAKIKDDYARMKSK